MGNRNWRLAAADLAASLLVTGCSGQDPEGSGNSSDSSGGSVTLRVNFWGDFGLDALKAQYEKVAGGGPRSTGPAPGVSPGGSPRSPPTPVQRRTMTTQTIDAKGRKPHRATQIGRAPQDTRGNWRTYLGLAAVMALSAQQNMYAKLRFPGRNALMFVVTLTVPNQLGVVALYIVMGKAGLARHPAFPTSMVALSTLASGNYVTCTKVPAGAFAATVPLLILLLIGGRQIVRGSMEGAVES